MVDASVLTASAKLLKELTVFFETVGPGWAFLFALLILGILAAVHIWKVNRADHIWHTVIQSKDDMINQINEHNRELRVQSLVVGGRFTKEEAVSLVYGKDRLNVTKQEERP